MRNEILRERDLVEKEIIRKIKMVGDKTKHLPLPPPLLISFSFSDPHHMPKTYK